MLTAPGAHQRQPSASWEKRVNGVHGAAWLAPGQHQILADGLDHDVICSQGVPVHVGRKGSSVMRIAHENPRHALGDFHGTHDLEFRPGDGVEIFLQVARCCIHSNARQISLAVAEMTHRADANAANRYRAGNRPLLASLVWLAGPMVAPVPTDGGWPHLHFQIQDPARLARHRYAIRIGPFGRELERNGRHPARCGFHGPTAFHSPYERQRKPTTRGWCRLAARAHIPTSTARPR